MNGTKENNSFIFKCRLTVKTHKKCLTTELLSTIKNLVLCTKFCYKKESVSYSRVSMVSEFRYTISILIYRDTNFGLLRVKSIVERVRVDTSLEVILII